jgi:magnesium transporter
MIKAIYLLDDGFHSEEHIKDLKGLLDKNPKLIWIDILLGAGELSLEEIATLSDHFKFHELSFEDCFIPQFYPKIEEFDNYVFGAVHGIRPKIDYSAEFNENIYELNFFIGKGFLVTVHAGEFMFIENFFARAKAKPHIEFKTIENLIYNIFGKMLNSFEFAMDKIDDKIDALQDVILEDPDSQQMQEILDLKKALLGMRKIAEQQQSAYVYFTRPNTDIIAKEYKAYFRDVFFHSARIKQSLEAHSKMVSSLMEVYLSSVTLRLNEIIKFLTIIATIFLPVLIVASYFGMNVKFPEYAIFGETGTWIFAISVILLATAGIFLYIKRKKWF